jgi:putative transposase
LKPSPKVTQSHRSTTSCHGPSTKRQPAKSTARTQRLPTTDSNQTFNIAPNLLDRNFTASQPNQKWAGDISYIWAREGRLYLAVILDLQSRRVIGWAVSNRMKRDLAIRALRMAIALRAPPKGCIFHSDRGQSILFARLPEDLA